MGKEKLKWWCTLSTNDIESQENSKYAALLKSKKKSKKIKIKAVKFICVENNAHNIERKAWKEYKQSYN